MSISRMNSFKLSGSTFFETCSAETTVPWITRRASSAPETAGGRRGRRLGRAGAAGGDACLFDLANAQADELGLYWLEVDLLHAGGRRRHREIGDLGQKRLGVLITGPQ